jgi:hypothetical protein
MDEWEVVMEAFRAQSQASVVSRLDKLMDLENTREPRVVPFLLGVLTDEREPVEVRVRVLKCLRDQSPASGLRELIGQAIVQLVRAGHPPQLRMHAVLALAEFVDLDGVPATLAAVALESDLALDFRYCAFSSLERARSTPECVALLRQLLTDEELGTAARSLLSFWRIEEPL